MEGGGGLSCSLRELDAEDKMAVTEAIHFLASACGVAAICETDESEALGSLGLSVSGKEDSGDAAEALEQIAKFSFFRQLGHVCNSQSRQIVLLVLAAHSLAAASSTLSTLDSLVRFHQPVF